MDNRYIGITIGPITRVTESARSTKALWATSYFFNYVAREIIRNFKEREFVYPLIKDELFDVKNGVGCFPDRYIFKSEQRDFDKLVESIEGENNIFLLVARGIRECIKSLDIDEKELCNFIRNCIKIYAFEKKTDEKGPYSNITAEFNGIFDVMEMQDTYNLQEDKNYLLHFFESKNMYKSFLVNDAFSEVKHFEDIDSIAKAELPHHPITPMAYHNYIAIISADGDHMTNAINALCDAKRNVKKNTNSPGAPEETNDLSEAKLDVNILSDCLYRFGQAVMNVIAEKYGARVIFIGGDDLLIFAPVKYGEYTVFDFVEGINAEFNNCMKDLPAPPTISFGIAIAYNKHPMGETLKESRECLRKAKEDHGRNAIVCSLQKHSGQTSSMFLCKRQASYQEALKLSKIYIGNENMISSLVHWIASNEQFLSIILREKELGAEGMRNYFKNSLDEDIHKLQETFITDIQEYILQLYSETQNAELTLSSVISLLRIIHFINTKDDKKL